MVVPTRVAEAEHRAWQSGFTVSSDRDTGRLLAVLACAVPAAGRVLEIGTGVGSGLAWIVEGLGARTDVEVHSVEANEVTAGLAAAGDWPEWVQLHVGDVRGLFDTLGSFDLIFADAPGGKWDNLDRTIAALTPRGVLVMDDMTPAVWLSEEHETKVGGVRQTLLEHPDLVTAELAWSTGLIVCSRRP